MDECQDAPTSDRHSYKHVELVTSPGKCASGSTGGNTNDAGGVEAYCEATQAKGVYANGRGRVCFGSTTGEAKASPIECVFGQILC